MKSTMDTGQIQVPTKVTDAWKVLANRSIGHSCPWCEPHTCFYEKLLVKDSAGERHRPECPWLAMDRVVVFDKMQMNVIREYEREVQNGAVDADSPGDRAFDASVS